MLDIGANQGFFTCYAAHRGARVYAFEPNPESYDMLLSNVNTNGLMDRVIARPWAVASNEGRADLLVSRELGGGIVRSMLNSLAILASRSETQSRCLPLLSLRWLIIFRCRRCDSARSMLKALK